MIVAHLINSVIKPTEEFSKKLPRNCTTVASRHKCRQHDWFMPTDMTDRSVPAPGCCQGQKLQPLAKASPNNTLEHFRREAICYFCLLSRGSVYTVLNSDEVYIAFLFVCISLGFIAWPGGGYGLAAPSFRALKGLYNWVLPFESVLLSLRARSELKRVRS